MTAAFATVLHAAALNVFIVAPGVLLHEIILSRLGLSWRASVGLVFAAATVLLTSAASLVGYSLRLAVAIMGLTLLIPLVYWARSQDKLRIETRPINWLQALMQLFVFAVFVAPAFVLFLPLDTDAQGFGYMALMIREGGTISTLAPWQPDVEYLYSPGLFLWWAAFSDLFQLPMHQVMLAFSHLVAGFTALLMFDLGESVARESKVMPWLLPLTFTAGLGYFLNMMDAAYTSVFALLFVILFFVLIFRSQQGVAMALLAAVPLGAVALTHPDTIIILLIGYIPFYATFWLAQVEGERRQLWLRYFVIAPVVGVALCIPWLIRTLPLFFEETIVSPFLVDPGHWVQLFLFQGAIIPLIGLPGVIIAIRQRRLVDVFMLTWLVFILDFSLYGGFAQLVGVTGIDLMRYAYPFSIAWHGPPIPYAYFAALTLTWVFKRLPNPVPERIQLALPSIGLLGIIVSVILAYPLMNFSTRYVNFFGTFSSRSDLEVMHYLREETEPDALILNYPLGFEAHWVPVIAERESITFREQPFFDQDALAYYQRRDDLTEAYFDPAALEAEFLLTTNNIDYVVIPQIVTQPGRFGNIREMIRWRWPEQYYRPLDSNPEDAPWLTLVYEEKGAALYEVVPSRVDTSE